MTRSDVHLPDEVRGRASADSQTESNYRLAEGIIIVPWRVTCLMVSLY